MRKILWATAAAVVVAAPLAVVTTTAQAAPSKDTVKLCTVPLNDPRGCTIGVPISAQTNGVREGDAVTAIVQGARNTTVDLAVFHVTWDAQGRPTKLTRISKPTSVTTNASGSGTTKITIDVLESPMTGGTKDFIVATADSSDVASIPGTSVGRWDQFAVHSARAKFMGGGNRPINGKVFTPGEQISYRVDAGIPGDRYLVQMKVNGSWVTLNVKDPSNGVVRASGTASIIWAFPSSIPVGKHPVRVSNAAHPDDPVGTLEFEIFADANQATPPPTAGPSVRPTTATPTARPTTASPTARPTTAAPTVTPTARPSTAAPTAAPTARPSTAAPTAAPSTRPSTAAPTVAPTARPSTAAPTRPASTAPAPTRPATTATAPAPTQPAPSEPAPAPAPEPSRDPAAPQGDPAPQDPSDTVPADPEPAPAPATKDSEGGLAHTGR